MAKRGRPVKYKDISEWRAIQRERSRAYYYDNREVILGKAKRKRRKQREQLAKEQEKQNENRGEMVNDGNK